MKCQLYVTTTILFNFHPSFNSSQCKGSAKVGLRNVTLQTCFDFCLVIAYVLKRSFLFFDTFQSSSMQSDQLYLIKVPELQPAFKSGYIGNQNSRSLEVEVEDTEEA